MPPIKKTVAFPSFNHLLHLLFNLVRINQCRFCRHCLRGVDYWCWLSIGAVGYSLFTLIFRIKANKHFDSWEITVLELCVASMEGDWKPTCLWSGCHKCHWLVHSSLYKSDSEEWCFSLARSAHCTSVPGDSSTGLLLLCSVLSPNLDSTSSASSLLLIP